VFDMLPNPPSIASPKFYYGNLAASLCIAGVFLPRSVNGFDKNGHSDDLQLEPDYTA